jgi:tetratricopeptide (TPR) repeat protein
MLAFARLRLGQATGALAAIDRALALAPGDARAWNNRGLILDAAGRPEESLASFARAIELDARDIQALCNRSRVLGSIGRPAAALEDLERALRIDPLAPGVQAARAPLLAALDRFEEALETCDEAAAAVPRDPTPWAQRGWVLLQLGRAADAEASLRQALVRAPNDALARYYLGLLLLGEGRWDEGWDAYESRVHVARISANRLDAARRWRGEDLAGRSLLLHFEQGLGDVVQFCRFAPSLAARASRVVLTVPAALRGLLESLGANVELVSEGEQPPSCDFECWLLGLGAILRLRPDTLASPRSYLSAPAQAEQRWRGRLGLRPMGPFGRDERRRFGLVCNGAPGHTNDRHRSLPLERFAGFAKRLRAMTGDGQGEIEWHLLQPQLRPRDEPWLARLGIVDHRAELVDFAETAALASCLDGVVSVDTSVAHVAGALGLPLHLLLPANADWRWGRAGRDSPWYPSARLYRQSRLGEWDDALDELARALAPSRSSARPRIAGA